MLQWWRAAGAGLASRGLDRWQAQVFAFLQRNAARATAFYNIPANRVVQLGSVVEI